MLIIIVNNKKKDMRSEPPLPIELGLILLASEFTYGCSTDFAIEALWLQREVDGFGGSRFQLSTIQTVGSPCGPLIASLSPISKHYFAKASIASPISQGIKRLNFQIPTKLRTERI